jgi:RNA polymerase sigma-70 factor (ECF subfamily)
MTQEPRLGHMVSGVCAIRVIGTICLVLDWRASEIAHLLSISVSAVNSALHRARVTLAKQYHVDERERAESLRADAAMQSLEDATFTMPPSPSWYRGRGAIRAVLTTQAFAPLAQNRWHFSPTGANGCPAFAVYRAAGSGGPSRAFGIQIVTLDAGASAVLIADVTTFLDPWLVTSFGFPHEPTQQTVSH